MGLVVANNLSAACGVTARLLGADAQTITALGLVNVAGSREGNGPLAAIVDALEISESDFVAFAPNDTPYFVSTNYSALFLAMTGTNADVAVAVEDHDATHYHWLLSVWRTSTCLRHLQEQYEIGVRSVYAAVNGLSVSTVAFSSLSLRNVNRPSDLCEDSDLE